MAEAGTGWSRSPQAVPCRQADLRWRTWRNRAARLRSRARRVPPHGTSALCSLKDQRRVRSPAVSPQVEKLIGEDSPAHDELIRGEHRRVERRQCENAIAAAGRAIRTLTVMPGKRLLDVVVEVSSTEGAVELWGLGRGRDRTYRRCNRCMRQRKRFEHNGRLSFRFAGPRSERRSSCAFHDSASLKTDCSCERVRHRRRADTCASACVGATGAGPARPGVLHIVS